MDSNPFDIVCGRCLFDTLKSQAIRDGKRPTEVGQYPPIRHPPGKRRTKKEMEWERSRPPLKGRILSGSCPVSIHSPSVANFVVLTLSVSFDANRSVEWSSMAVSGLYREKAVSSIWKSVPSRSSSGHPLDFGHWFVRRATLPPAFRGEAFRSRHLAPDNRLVSPAASLSGLDRHCYRLLSYSCIFDFESPSCDTYGAADGIYIAR